MRNLLTPLTQIGAWLSLLAVPALAFAQETGDSPELELDTLTGVVDEILLFIDSTVVPVIFALAFLVFIWGMFVYFIVGANSEEKRGEGKNLLLWGLIGFVVMLSVWGIVTLLINSFGLVTERPCLPQFSGGCAE